MGDYLKIMKNCGLENLQVQKEKIISIPDEILLNYLNPDELESFKATGTGIYSITVYAEKPVNSLGCGCGCNC
jgi:hypothetical protein